MKIFDTQKNREILEAIKYFNYCHDGCITKVEFTKEREVSSDDGSLIFPFGDIRDTVFCDIKVEMILNSYAGSKKDQKVKLVFKKTQEFCFLQKNNWDYSDVYEMKFSSDESGNLIFSFYVTEEKKLAISLTCRSIEFGEL